MIKRYCDRCKVEIKNRDFRKLSIVDSNDCLIKTGDECIQDTIQDVELCRPCAYAVLQMIKGVQYNR